MAKLNEPPVVGESVEALKRRFMRQNRELAKSNSTLNIRIANLEADRSQLLSDNITLRDENNQLRQELEKNLDKRALQNVGSVKEKLAKKVGELNELMLLLDKAHTERPQPTPAPKATKRRSFYRSPTHQRNWRSTLYGPEVTGLAPIVEGKHFPRRTLDADELQSDLPDLGPVAESPELGPPPVAHFDEGDPVKLDPQRDALHDASLEADTERKDSDTPQGLGFANLETRRRRRPSSLVRDTKTSDDPAAAKETEIVDGQTRDTGQAIRAGAKRKLSLREDDEGSARSKTAESDGFAFNRKVESSKKPSRDENSTTPALVEKVSEKAALDRRREPTVTRFNRKALGEKSVNTDPVVSPAKAKSSGTAKPKDSGKESLAKSKVREAPAEKPNVEQGEQRKILERTVKDLAQGNRQLLPNTPAPPEPDLFSPLDSRPSSTKPDSRDTPPPADIGNDGGRPSRRQRAAVSYAEPNLRDKMRRPGKELVDAVTVSNKATSSANPKADASLGLVKEEEIEGSGWKNLPVDKPYNPVEPASPLGNKSSSSATELPSSVLTDRRRRSSVAQRNPEEANAPAPVPSAVSQSTIAALVAGSQKRLYRAREAAEAQRRLSGERGALDIYDFNDSSPAEARDKEPKDPARMAGASRLSRRHSSMSDMQVGSRLKEGPAAGLARSNSAAAGGLSVGKESSEALEDGAKAARVVTLGRAERAAARRKSMMV